MSFLLFRISWISFFLFLRTHLLSIVFPSFNWKRKMREIRLWKRYKKYSSSVFTFSCSSLTHHISMEQEKKTEEYETCHETCFMKQTLFVCFHRSCSCDLMIDDSFCRTNGSSTRWTDGSHDPSISSFSLNEEIIRGTTVNPRIDGSAEPSNNDVFVVPIVHKNDGSAG